MKNPDFIPTTLMLRGSRNELIQVFLLHDNLIRFQYQERRTGAQLDGIIDDKELDRQKDNHSIPNVASLYQFFLKSEATRFSIESSKLSITLLQEEDGLINQEEVLVDLQLSHEPHYSQTRSERAELLELRELFHQLRKEFIEYKQQHSLSQQKRLSQNVLLTQIEALKHQVQMCRAVLGSHFCKSFHKHKQITATPTLMANRSEINQIRWILLGQPLSRRMHQKWLFHIDCVTWMTLGLADQRQLEYRKYEGLNGRSDHGCHVMDSTGWIHTTKGSIYNYQQMGFTFSSGDQLYLEIDGLREKIKFVNQNSLQVFALSFASIQSERESLFVAVAVNKECVVTYRQLINL